MEKTSAMSQSNLENTDPTVERTPVVLLLDTSRSMRRETEGADGTVRENIDHVNRGLELFKEEIIEDYHSKTRVDICVVTFGGDVEVKQEFTTIDEWEPPTLTKGGNTPMGKGIDRAMDKTEERKEEIKNSDRPYNRPLIWMLTDGAPTDMRPGDQTWNDVQDLIEVGTKDKRLMFFAVGIGDDADMDTLNDLTSVIPENRGGAFQLEEGKFAQFFELASESAKQVSNPGEDDEMPAQVPSDSE